MPSSETRSAANPLDLLLAGLESALTGLTAEQAQARPPAGPEKWSIQQIVEHLHLTYRTTESILQQRIHKGRPTQATPTLMQRGGQLFIIRLGRFPTGRPAPAAVTPSATSPHASGQQLIQISKDLFAALNLACDDAERLFGRRQAASHLILGPLSIPQWRTFHLVHGRHHLKQIHAIRTAHQI